MTLGDLLEVYTPSCERIKVQTAKSDGTIEVHFEGERSGDLTPYMSREIADTFFSGSDENRTLCIELCKKEE